ncbi:Zinc finger E-box-binding homeobox 1 [Oryzias melastigma]|uniref:Zinc finger E-box-binding homeobox 1 n=1 Tax=Oryzias melastigma TaxID=30732 RepID=A0A834L1P8_ORYME|nr:Zinc finger E-box-binding homeobox 1 [Oryzias melastigma]
MRRTAGSSPGYFSTGRTPARPLRSRGLPLFSENNPSAAMTEESRGKRRKQANPRRNRGMKGVEAETALKSAGTTVYYRDPSRDSAQASEPVGGSHPSILLSSQPGLPLTLAIARSPRLLQRLPCPSLTPHAAPIPRKPLQTVSAIKDHNAEQVSSLGSEEEDKVWSLGPPDCQEDPDKTSLTPSEGTEEAGSPRPHSLSPGGRNGCAQAESEAKSREDAAFISADGGQESLRMYCKSSDSQNSLEDLSHYDFWAHLRKASTSASIWDHLSQNGVADVYRSSRHDDLPPAIWSPGAQQCSPEGSDAVQMQQRCPFCHRTFLRGASLRDHVKFCQDREGGPMVCPLCGYTSTFSSHMERHLLLHNQLQDKAGITSDQGMDNRKFKCLQCGKAFKYKHHLKEHLRIHSGEKPYECSNCKKRFSHSGSYSSHLSSKKCLSGGGHAGLNASGLLNGHSQNSYPHSLSTSPSAGKSREDSQNQESTRAVGQAPTSPQQMLLPDLKPNTASLISASSVSRSWSPSPELPPRAGFLKGNTLLPFFHSGARFEQMLQGMLHREADKEMEKDKLEDSNVVYNGGGHEKKVSPDRNKEAVRSSDGESSVFGVTCRWCLQLFPNMAVLLQHERYLCKNNREAIEVSDGPQRKDQSSPPMFFSRSSFQSEKNKPSELLNGFSGKKSPLEKPSWHYRPTTALGCACTEQQRPVLTHVLVQSRQRKPATAHTPLSGGTVSSEQKTGSIRTELSGLPGPHRLLTSNLTAPRQCLVCTERTAGPVSTQAAVREKVEQQNPERCVSQRGEVRPTGSSSTSDLNSGLSLEWGRLSFQAPYTTDFQFSVSPVWDCQCTMEQHLRLARQLTALDFDLL